MAKNSLKAKWETLAPKHRQQLALGGMILAVGGLAFAMLTGSGPGSAQADPAKLDARVSNQLLPDQNIRDIGMSGIAKDVEQERESRQSLEEKVARLEGLFDEMQRADQQGGPSRARDEQLRQQLEALTEQVTGLKAQGPNGNADPTSRGDVTGQPVLDGASMLPAAYGGIRTIGSAVPVDQARGASGDESAAVEEGPPPPPEMYLPSGSMLDGVMLTGLDAPTGKGALKDPVPVLVRIQKEAILPNRFRADVRECFALVAGQGDLASERAYLRSETISCVRNDKSVIDLNMKAYVVDTDGKAGLRGRLVSKQGSVVSKAILASFADGIAQAFKGNAPRLQLGGGSAIDYGDAMNSGAVMGMSSSLDRISKYYLDLADQLFPILEIDAGREVTLVLVKGLEMQTVR